MKRILWKSTVSVWCLVAAYSTLAAVAASPAHAAVKVISQVNNAIPVTVFNITFRVGSADDPKGKEGLAALTASLLREGGVRELKLGKKNVPARTRAEIEEFLFPLAAEIDTQVAREQTSFRVTVASRDAGTVFDVLTQIFLAPALDAKEFERLRAELAESVEKRAPREDQEELGKAALERRMYGAAHPYGHIIEGTRSGLKSITLADVQSFFNDMYTQKRLTVGVAGVVSAQISKDIQSRFGKLPAGTSVRATIPEVPIRKGLRVLVVKGPFEATGVHLGHPVPFTRGSPEFAEMYLASTAFGKHRSFVGRLMHNVRELRGLNYGTYSYVEEFPLGGHRLSVPTQVARTRQAFTVWGRPTPTENGCFLLRQLHRELKQLTAPKGGLSPEEFETGKRHLVGSIPLLATGIDRQLGFAIDADFYGIKGNSLTQLQSKVRAATRPRVNSLLRAYVHPDDLDVVVVTGDANSFKNAILGESCAVHYQPGIEKPKAVLDEDALISKHDLHLKPEQIEIVEAETLFE